MVRWIHPGFIWLFINKNLVLFEVIGIKLLINLSFSLPSSYVPIIHFHKFFDPISFHFSSLENWNKLHTSHFLFPILTCTLNLASNYWFLIRCIALIYWKAQILFFNFKIFSSWLENVVTTSRKIHSNPCLKEWFHFCPIK